MPHVNSNLTDAIALPIKDYTYSATIPIPPAEMLYKSFTVDGADQGSIDMAVDGTTPISFRYTVPEGRIALPHRVIFALMDINIQYEFFAGLGAVLANGIQIRLLDTDDSVLLDFTNGVPIKSTHEFVVLAGGDVNILQTSLGVDPDMVGIRWTLDKTGYVPYLTAGQSFEILISDNLAAVDHLHAFVQGRVVSPTH